MKRNIMLICISLVLLILLVSCANNVEQQIVLRDFPTIVGEDDEFNIEGEYLTSEATNQNSVEINLSVTTIESKQTLYNERKVIEDKSQNFTFENISLDEINEEIYFELSLIIDGDFIMKTDTSDSPVLNAKWHQNIKTSYFLPEDSNGNPLKGTWNNYLTEENPFYFALPYRDFYYTVDGSEEPVRKDYYGISDVKNRWIEILYIDGDNKVSVYAQWVDVGPWNYYDPYYVFGDQRPYAEMGIDMGWSSKGYRETNKAGLDVSPTVMEYLSDIVNQDFLSEGIMEVNWRFVEEKDVPDGPWLKKVSTSQADPEEFNLETSSLRNR